MATWTVARDQMMNLASYLQDGECIRDAVRMVQQRLARYERLADDFTFYAFESISTTKDSVDATAGARPLVIVIKSNGTKAFVKLYNNAVGSVTAGGDADISIPVSNTAGECAVYTCLGSSSDRFWDTGLTASCSSDQEGNSAPANPPHLYILASGA